MLLICPLLVLIQLHHCNRKRRQSLHLTTDSIFEDLSVDSGQGEDATLLSLTSIFFHCPFIKESANSQNGKVSLLCKWCGKFFTPRHQSRALKHVLKLHVVILPFALQPFPRTMRINTVHCMTKMQNNSYQGNAHIHTLMML